MQLTVAFLKKVVYYKLIYGPKKSPEGQESVDKW